MSLHPLQQCPMCGSTSTMQEVLTFADLRIDGFTVSRSGQVVRLTPTEYRLLKFLVRNKNRVVTRDMIHSHVLLSFSNAVDTMINYLRNKLDYAFPHLPPLISTVRGFGYIIGAQQALDSVGASVPERKTT